MTLLPVSHYQQQQQSDCLVACTFMVLDYLQVPINYQRLEKLLRAMSGGTPFRNLRYIESIGLSVLIEDGNIETLRRHLVSGLPPIVALNSGQLLSYWPEQTDHAVVVLGIENNLIYLYRLRSKTTLGKYYRNPYPPCALDPVAHLVARTTR